MPTYPVPFNEESRSGVVRDFPGLTRENEPVFDAICRAVAALLDCPIAHISVIEETSQWYKSVVGIELGEMPKETSFCTHTIMSDKPMVIEDLSKHPTFAEHPMVVEGGPKARFYAGVPLILSSGYRFGSLCALDFKAHKTPSARAMEVLTELGVAVVAAIERQPPEAVSVAPASARATFLTLVGHELRTPLTVMQGSLRLLEMRLVDDPVNAQLAGSARKSTDHLTRLIEAILKYSDVNTGDLKLNEKVTDLSMLIAQVHEAHAGTVDEHGKNFTALPTAAALNALVDPEHIQVCLTSLLLNSILHGGDAMEVAASVDADGDFMLTVRDNGALDSHLDLAALYEPFVVGANVENRGTEGGLGLGLPLTRKLVEMHGGTFDVLSDDDGTTARIRLPKWRGEDIPAR